MDKIDSNSRNDHSLLGYATYPTVIDKTKPKAFRRLHWLRVWDVNHVCWLCFRSRNCCTRHQWMFRWYHRDELVYDVRIESCLRNSGGHLDGGFYWWNMQKWWHWVVHKNSIHCLQEGSFKLEGIDGLRMSGGVLNRAVIRWNLATI